MQQQPEQTHAAHKFYSLSNINFELADVDTRSAKVSLHGIIGGVPLPFPLPNNDACKMGVACPIKTGDTNTFILVVFVQPAYPKVRITTNC